MKWKKSVGLALALLTFLSATTVVLADSDTNDSFDAAEAVGEGTFTGTVSSGLLTDEDYYVVSVPAERSVLVTLNSDAGDSVDVTLYDGNRAEQDYDWSDSGTLAYVFYDGGSSDTYTIYLLLSGDGGYTFTVEFRPSNMRSSAIMLNDGDVVSDVIEVGEERHWYAVHISTGEGVQISGTADKESFCMDVYNSSTIGEIWDETTYLFKYSSDKDDVIYICAYTYESGYVDTGYDFVISVFSVPSSPRDLQARTDGMDVLLSWSPPSDDGGVDIDGYYLYRNGIPLTDLGWDVVSDWGASPILITSTSYTDNTTYAGVEYTYSVSAVNWVGEGDKSQSVSVTPIDVPWAPYFDEEPETGDGYVKITWVDSEIDGGSAVTEYRIYRGMSSGHETLLGSVPASTTTYRDDSVKNGVTYYYYVTAVNEAGESEAGEEVSATPYGPPSSPRNLNIVANKDSIVLTWSGPDDNGGSEILYYNIYRGTSPDNMEVIDSVPYGTTTYTDKSVEAGKTYYYSVSASNNVSESSASSSVSVKAPDNISTSWILIALLVVIAAIVVGILFMRKKKKSEPPKE